MAWAAVRVVDNASTSTNASIPMEHALLDVALVIEDTRATNVRIWCIAFIAKQFDAKYQKINELHYNSLTKLYLFFWKKRHPKDYRLIYILLYIITYQNNKQKQTNKRTHHPSHTKQNVFYYASTRKNDMAMSFSLSLPLVQSYVSLLIDRNSFNVCFKLTMCYFFYI